MFPPPPLSILIPAMHSMGGTEFIVVPDGSHWRGEGASREGGQEGTEGQRARPGNNSAQHESKRVRLCTTPLHPTHAHAHAGTRAPPRPPTTPTPPTPHPPPQPPRPPTPTVARQTSCRRKKKALLFVLWLHLIL